MAYIAPRSLEESGRMFMMSPGKSLTYVYIYRFIFVYKCIWYDILQPCVRKT